MSEIHKTYFSFRPLKLFLNARMSAKHKNSQSSYTWKELKPDDLNMYIRDSLVILWLIYLSFSGALAVCPPPWKWEEKKIEPP